MPLNVQISFLILSSQSGFSSALERASICHAAPRELCLWLVTVGFDDLIVEQPEGLLVLGQLTESVDQNVIAKGIDRDWKLVS